MKRPIDHQAQFEGFQNTPTLWETNELFSLKQFHIQNTSANFIPKLMPKSMRLGKWVEAYTSFQLQKQTGIEIIAENKKIYREKQTIGELDLLLFQINQPIHLEIAYKFYLYDTTQDYDNPLAPWIGPNRKDSLLFKLEKLKEKQLPLLHKVEAKNSLEEYGLSASTINQYVCFKAQLFLPYQNRTMTIDMLNPNCVYGWYLGFNEIALLNSNSFYIPSKLEWLITPNDSVEWLNYDDAVSIIKEAIERKQSPMCWIKSSTNQLQKCFITWW